MANPCRPQREQGKQTLASPQQTLASPQREQGKQTLAQPAANPCQPARSASKGNKPLPARSVSPLLALLWA
jgi:hypothetical protein